MVEKLREKGQDRSNVHRGKVWDKWFERPVSLDSEKMETQIWQ